MSEARNSQRLVLGLLGLLGLLIGVMLWTLYHLPRSEAITMHRGQMQMFSGSCTGYYRGLGWHNDPGYFGKNWFSLTADFHHYTARFRLEAEIEAFGYVPFRSYYQNGSLQAEGKCLLKWEPVSTGPVFFPLGIREANYYDRQGKPLSTIRLGEGVFSLQHKNGKSVFQMAILSSRVLSTHDGAISQGSSYRGYGEVGSFRGPYFILRQDGSLASIGHYGRGGGLQYDFAEDGSILKWHDNSEGQNLREVYQPNERYPSLEEQAWIDEVKTSILAPYKKSSY